MVIEHGKSIDTLKIQKLFLQSHILNKISCGIVHHLEPVFLIADNTQRNLNGQTSRVTDILEHYNQGSC